MLNIAVDIMSFAARTDFRLEKLVGQPVWYVAVDAAADPALDQGFVAEPGRPWRCAGRGAGRAAGPRAPRFYRGGAIFVPLSVR